ncbi:hypothetical protein JCM10207_008080 [Rhodosporidiobolus poonsookiae]
MTQQGSEGRSPHISDDTVSWLEEVRDHKRASRLDALAALWGRPCFEMVKLPPLDPSNPVSKALDGVQAVPRARLSLDDDPPRVFRQDYCTLWKGMSVHRDRQGKAFVIWGQPGNGKSCALDVYTFICVEQEVPVLRWKLGASVGFLIVVVDKVPRTFTVPSDSFDKIDFKRDNFFFVDAGDPSDKIGGFMASSPGGFLPRTTMVLATSPRPDRYSEWRLQGAPTLSLPDPVTATPIKFDQLQFQLPTIPPDGYPDSIVASDLSPLFSADAGGNLFYSPLFLYHALGPDLRRLFSPPLVSVSDLPADDSAYMDDVLDAIPFDDILADAKVLKSLLKPPGNVSPTAVSAGSRQLFYHAPSPGSDKPASRWTRPVQFETRILSAPAGDRVRSLVTKSRLEEQRALVTSLAGTGAVHGYAYEALVFQEIAQAKSIKISVAVMTQDASLSFKEIVVSLPNGDIHAPWRPSVAAPAPSAVGVHPTLPSTFSAVDALVVGVDSEHKSVAIALQCTISLDHDVGEYGIKTTTSRLDERDEAMGGDKSRRLYVFATPARHGAAEKLARRHAKDAGSFEVGFVYIG